MKISEECLSRIQEQIDLKNKAAGALGVASVEMELEKLRISDPQTDMTRGERFFRLGAVQSEFDGYRATHMGVVLKANARQREIGEEALAQIGLTSPTRIFTIDERNGEVFELVNGAYVPVKEAA